MKIRNALILGLLMLLSISSFAQDSKLPMDIPVYPGGETSMEVNLSNEDILPTIKAMLPMVSGKIAQKVDANELAAILKDVKRIQVLEVDICKAGVTDSAITSYYAKNLPTGNWNRVYWQSTHKNGTIAVYALGDAESLYGFRIQTVKIDGTPTKQVMIGKIQGKLDFAKLLALAGKFTTL